MTRFIKALLLCPTVLALPHDRSKSVIATLENGNQLEGFLDESWYKQGNINEYFSREGISEKSIEHGNYGQEERFRKVETYLGIPFAEKMSKKNRFKKSKVHRSSWEGIRDAKSIRSRCWQELDDLSKEAMLQPDKDFKFFSEDCLTLNIYKPKTKTKTDEKLPIYFWIHGGGFSLGSSYEYDGAILAASQNVIVISINYRLGIFGFYSNENLKGNYGLWDMVTALKWTHENIGQFGGDPKEITIAGESAGGGAVSALLYHDAQRSNGLMGLAPLKKQKRKPLFKTCNPHSGVLNGFMKKPWMSYKRHQKIHQNLKARNFGQFTDPVYEKFYYHSIKVDEGAIEGGIKSLSAEDLTHFMGTYGYDIDIFGSGSYDMPVFDDDFFAGYGWLEKVLAENSDKTTKTFNDYLEKELHLYTDLTGYNINYGLLNGEGTMAYLYPPAAIAAVPFGNLIQNMSMALLHDDILNEQYKSCQFHNCCKDYKKSLKDISRITDFSFENEWTNKKFPTELAITKKVAAKIKSWYNPKNNNAEYDRTLVQFENEKANKQWLEDQARVQIFGDFVFNFYTVQDFYNSQDNNANVDAFFIKRSITESQIFKRSFDDTFSKAEYGFHGDDLNYLFGLVFCNEHIVEAAYVCKTVVTGERYSVSDREASFASLNYYFRQSKGKGNNREGQYTLIKQDGIAHRKTNLYGNELKYLKNIIKPIYGSKRNYKVENCEQDRKCKPKS